jgi:hypothetical protein
MRKYGESKVTRIMMATARHVTSGSGLRKFQVDGFLFDKVYIRHVFRVFLQLLFETFFILRRTERDVIENVCWSS